VLTNAFVLAPGSGTTLDMGPFRMTVKASAANTEGGLTVLEADEPADFGPPMHIHDDAGEAFYVLAGEYIVYIGTAEHRCPPERSFGFRPALSTASASARLPVGS
jgi:mannose-6-phosphate isomerase-like protein (cupin superfamily)